MKTNSSPLRGQTGAAMQIHRARAVRAEQAAFDAETKELIRRFKPKDQPKVQVQSRGYQRNLATLKKKLRNRGIPETELANLDLPAAMKLWKQVKDSTRQNLPS